MLIKEAYFFPTIATYKWSDRTITLVVREQRPLSKFSKTLLHLPRTSRKFLRKWTRVQGCTEYSNWSQNKPSPRQRRVSLFLKYNLRAVSYRTNLCSPPDDFRLPNKIMYDGPDENEETARSAGLSALAWLNEVDAGWSEEEFDGFGEIYLPDIY